MITENEAYKSFVEHWMQIDTDWTHHMSRACPTCDEWVSCGGNFEDAARDIFTMAFEAGFLAGLHKAEEVENNIV